MINYQTSIKILLASSSFAIFVLANAQSSQNLPNDNSFFSPPGTEPTITIQIPNIANAKLLNSEMNGFQTVDFFSGCAFGTAITNTNERPDCLTQFMDLKPKLLRFPGGTISQFSHPLCNLPGQQQGYGFKPSEILQFFNGYYVNDSEPYNQNDYNEKISKWQGLTTKNSFATTRYIDDFINLVHAMENENPDVPVKVIYVANILTGTTQELIDILQLFKTNNITIAGIELGNEMTSYPRIFESGTQYYNFVINGIPDPNDNWFNNSFSGGAITHDYCRALRINSDVWIRNIPFGISASPMAFQYTPFSGASIYTASGTNDNNQNKYTSYNSWNQEIALFRNVNRLFIIGSTYVYKPAFDSYIFHPYYKSSLWSNSLSHAPSAYFQTGQLNFTSPNQPGLHDPIAFNDFENVKNEILHFTSNQYTVLPHGGAVQIFDYYADVFHLFLNGDGSRKLWMTEWNVLGDSDDPIQNIWTNTYLQSLYSFNWILTSYKMSVDSRYKQNWLEFGLFHNTIGGSVSSFDNLFSPLDSKLDENAPEFISDNVSRRRSSYFGFYQLQKIGKGSYYLNTFTNDSSVISNFVLNYSGNSTKKILSYFNQSKFSWYVNNNNTSIHQSERYKFPQTINYGISNTMYAEAQLPYYQLSPIGSNVSYIGNGANTLTQQNLYYNVDDGIYAPYAFQVISAGLNAYPQLPLVYGYNLGLLNQDYSYLPMISNSNSDYENAKQTGILENDLAKGQAYPVPADDVMNIPVTILNEDAILEVFDAMGRLVMEQSAAPNAILKLDTRNLDSGMYSYRLRTATSAGTARAFSVAH